MKHIKMPTCKWSAKSNSHSCFRQPEAWTVHLVAQVVCLCACNWKSTPIKRRDQWDFLSADPVVVADGGFLSTRGRGDDENSQIITTIADSETGAFGSKESAQEIIGVVRGWISSVLKNTVAVLCRINDEVAVKLQKLGVGRELTKHFEVLQVRLTDSGHAANGLAGATVPEIRRQP